jgi:predicted N-acetyltransferase YhbS
MLWRGQRDARHGRLLHTYTLAATSVALDQVPVQIAKRLPRYPGLPALLIGRLAVHVDDRGHGLGDSLIMDAAVRTDKLGVGAFALVVAPKDDNARIL